MDELPARRHSLIFRLRDTADAAAWGEFVALYEPLIYRLARRKGLQDADARDLGQEVFRALSRSVESWDPARGGFRAWLSQICRNLLINFLTRRHQPRGSGATSVQELLEARPADDPAATALFEAEYRRHLFRWAIGKVQGEVSPTTWQAFWRTAVEGCPAGQIAAELRLSVGAVYVARSRVLARLRRQVEEFGDGEAILDEVHHEDPMEPL
jgi:RNA polymerase sigma factor (sigma-70 family)